MLRHRNEIRLDSEVSSAYLLTDAQKFVCILLYSLQEVVLAPHLGAANMAAKLAVHDPLALNLRGQTLFLLEKLPLDSPHAKTLRSVPSRSQLLQTLSHLLHTPSLTTLVATAFRPILLDLCARWLENSENLYEKLEAVCLLLEIHPELYP